LPAYTVTDSHLSGRHRNCRIRDEFAGVTCGYYKDLAGTVHGFLFSDGTDSPFDIKSADGTWVTGINDNNEIAGYFEISGATEGFIAQKGSIVPFTVSKTSATSVSALNNTGEVAGKVQGGTTESLTYGGYYVTDPGASTPVELLASKPREYLGSGSEFGRRHRRLHRRQSEGRHAGACVHLFGRVRQNRDGYG
jgi:hypothetical protein